MIFVNVPLVRQFQVRLLGWLALSAVLLVVAGCSGTDAPPEPVAPPAMPTPEVPTPGAPAVPVEGRQLVVWLPPFSGIALDEPAGAVLDDAFYQFEQLYPGVNVDVHVKAEFGPAGMAAFLRSAQQVAPSILPDLVLIRTQQLWPLVDLGLVPPLSQGEFPDFDDFYPAGLDAVHYRDQLHGIPFSADMLVLVYDPARVATAPRTWDELGEVGLPLLFAAGSSEVSTGLPALLQYVAAGGELREDGGFTAPDALAAWFDFLASAQAQGLIDPRSLDLSMSDAVWRSYQSQPDGLAWVLAGDALSQPGLAARLALAPAPTQAGQTAAVGPTWALALLTTDPEQRRLAIDLVGALLAPEVQGLWSRLAHRLPSRRGALAVWTAGDGDVVLLEELLGAAVALPNGRPFAEFARRVQLAQQGVLRGEMTSPEAILFVRAGE